MAPPTSYEVGSVTPRLVDSKGANAASAKGSAEVPIGESYEVRSLQGRGFSYHGRKLQIVVQKPRTIDWDERLRTRSKSYLELAGNQGSRYILGPLSRAILGRSESGRQIIMLKRGSLRMGSTRNSILQNRPGKPNPKIVAPVSLVVGPKMQIDPSPNADFMISRAIKEEEADGAIADKSANSAFTGQAKLWLQVLQGSLRITVVGNLDDPSVAEATTSRPTTKSFVVGPGTYGTIGPTGSVDTMWPTQNIFADLFEVSEQNALTDQGRTEQGVSFAPSNRRIAALSAETLQNLWLDLKNKQYLKVLTLSRAHLARSKQRTKAPTLSDAVQLKDKQLNDGLHFLEAVALRSLGFPNLARTKLTTLKAKLLAQSISDSDDKASLVDGANLVVDGANVSSRALVVFELGVLALGAGEYQSAAELFDQTLLDDQFKINRHFRFWPRYYYGVANYGAGSDRSSKGYFVDLLTEIEESTGSTGKTEASMKQLQSNEVLRSSAIDHLQKLEDRDSLDLRIETHVGFDSDVYSLGGRDKSTVQNLDSSASIGSPSYNAKAHGAWRPIQGSYGYLQLDGSAEYTGFTGLGYSRSSRIRYESGWRSAINLGVGQEGQVGHPSSSRTIGKQPWLKWSQFGHAEVSTLGDNRNFDGLVGGTALESPRFGELTLSYKNAFLIDPRPAVVDGYSVLVKEPVGPGDQSARVVDYLISGNLWHGYRSHQMLNLQIQYETISHGHHRARSQNSTAMTGQLKYHLSASYRYLVETTLSYGQVTYRDRPTKRNDKVWHALLNYQSYLNVSYGYTFNLRYKHLTSDLNGASFNKYQTSFGLFLSL